jgi:hypothetical protein
MDFSVFLVVVMAGLLCITSVATLLVFVACSRKLDTESLGSKDFSTLGRAVFTAGKSFTACRRQIPSNTREQVKIGHTKDVFIGTTKFYHLITTFQLTSGPHKSHQMPVLNHLPRFTFLQGAANQVWELKGTDRII